MVFCCLSLGVLYSRVQSAQTLMSIFDGSDVNGQKCNIPFTPDSCTPILPLFVGSGKDIASRVTLKYTEKDRESLCMGNKQFSLEWRK